jgi:hypothetical protein
MHAGKPGVRILVGKKEEEEASAMNRLLSFIPEPFEMDLELAGSLRAYDAPTSGFDRESDFEYARERGPCGCPSCRRGEPCPCKSQKEALMTNMRDIQPEAFEFQPETSFGEFESEFGEFEFEEEASSFRFVKDFSGPAAECAAALRRANKTKAQALTIINTQIGIAIAMLRKAAKDLRRENRSATTKALFHKIFRVNPEFVPTWLKQTTTIKDRGDVVRVRCEKVADLLASGTLRFFCAINATNCPDCARADPNDWACSSYGTEGVAPRRSNVVCLGNAFWNDMKAGNTSSLVATLMHEPFHIYYGIYVTEHLSPTRPRPGKFGGIYCILQFVFESNGRTAPQRVNDRCTRMAVRREIGPFLA